jgi:hypothetical protein
MRDFTVKAQEGVVHDLHGVVVVAQTTFQYLGTKYEPGARLKIESRTAEVLIKSGRCRPFTDDDERRYGRPPRWEAAEAAAGVMHTRGAT